MILPAPDLYLNGGHMAVRLRNKRTGKERLASDKHARILERLGKWERVPEPEPTPARTRAARPIPPPMDPAEPEDEAADEVQDEIEDEYSDLTYNEARALAIERDLEVEGRKKDDYLRALRYGTRAMTAED